MRLRRLAVVAVLEVCVTALVPGIGADPSMLRAVAAAVLLALAALASLVVVAPSRPLASWAIQLQVVLGVVLLVLVPAGAQAARLGRPGSCLVVAASIVAVVVALWLNARRAPLWKYASPDERGELRSSEVSR